MDELSPNGGLIPTPVVEEVRTGQQFLIRLQLSKSGVLPTPTSSSHKFPTMRVDRREAINTSGEPRADVEPLTLQIIVHLAKSGQIRKGACAKCCHKYGPSSPILVLLDPLSPSATDPTNFAHVDTSTGKVTILAKVICSSTDHSERGNKDRYKFEFRLKRTSSRLEEDDETLATCYTPPIMCSGHHKAKRVYPQQRPLKGVNPPSPKTKTIKRHKSSSNLSGSSNYPMYSDHAPDEFLRSDSISFGSNLSPMGYFEQLANPNPNDPPEHDHSHRYQQQRLSASSETLTSNGQHMLDPSQGQVPRVMEIRPNHGPIRKTTDVVLRGLYFREGMVPYFGCFPAQDIVVETANLILCKAPESPLPGTVAITIYDTDGTSYADLGQFTYTDDSETELLILQLQLRMAHRALEYLHARATGQNGSATDILREIPDMGSSPGSGSGAMDYDAMSMTEASDRLLTREEVEEGILRTLDQLPLEMDISLQIDQQGNLLHLSILMGYDRLARRLIADGCDIEALDAWSMTPLMYAVVKGNEAIVRDLVLAGATSSGARTTQEFFACLPRATTLTPAVLGYLSLSCTRFSNITRTLVANASSLPDMVEVQYEDDEGEASNQEDQESETQASESSSQPTLLVPSANITSDTTSPVAGEELMTRITENIAGVYLNQDMPPLGQQDLPPMQSTRPDGSVEINTKVLKGVDIAREFAGVADAEHEATESERPHVAQLRQESGYQSGVYAAVQDRLNELQKADLPSKGVEMAVKFIKPPAPPTASATPANLFRTGDTFHVQVQLTMLPGSAESELPREYLGLQFPQELVKRASGMPPSLLNEMTYILKTSIELGGKASSSSSGEPSTHDDHHHQGDGIALDGACQACTKYLLQHKKLLPGQAAALANPASYPVLQFVIPGPAPTVSASTGELVTPVNNVMEVRDGLCDVRARVNCSSLHHLVQREKAKRMELLRQQRELGGSISGGSAPGVPSKGKTQLDMSDLKDPGFVFSFELVHPTLHSVVARAQVGPLNFQSYSLKK
ncbi:SPT3 Dosage dependent suppressor of Ty-induced promoter mutations-like protein [Podila minutissima]|nr:SPT3 Dosage dependent suppressor of Ty-induced promoter mutations-like protein [Podila minutissima]